MNIKLNYYINNILSYEFINKFNKNSINKFPKIQKIVLSFNFKHAAPKKVLASLFVFNILTLKKGSFIQSTKTNIKLNLRKGDIVGCKITLITNDLYKFLIKYLINKTYVKVKDTNKSSFAFTIQKIFVFDELKPLYNYCDSVNNLQINVITSCLDRQELEFFIKSLKM